MEGLIAEGFFDLKNDSKLEKLGTQIKEIGMVKSEQDISVEKRLAMTESPGAEASVVVPLAHPMFLWFWVMAALVVLGMFLWEGATQDRQSLTAVMKVGGKTARDMTETLSSPIRVSLRQEKMIGRRMLRYFRWLSDRDPRTLRVRRVGRQLARQCKRKGIRYRFYVIDTSIPNAFALPGGYILVTTGLLRLANPARQDSELAWVLGHELIHIERRHAWVQLRLWLARRKLRITLLREASKLALFVTHWLKLGYSENMELEADKDGLALMRRADFYAPAALTMVDKFLLSSGASTRLSRTMPSSRHPWLIGVRVTQKTIRQYWATHPHWVHRKALLQRWLR